MSITYEISKEFALSASHQLTHLPGPHPCSRLHGHNYAVTVQLCGVTLDENGFILDYRELSGFKAFIDGELDHRHLNDVLTPEFTGMPGFVTTAENIAEFLLRVATAMYGHKVDCISVSETPKTLATARWPGQIDDSSEWQAAQKIAERYKKAPTG